MHRAGCAACVPSVLFEGVRERAEQRGVLDGGNAQVCGGTSDGDITPRRVLVQEEHLHRGEVHAMPRRRQAIRLRQRTRPFSCSCTFMALSCSSSCSASSSIGNFRRSASRSSLASLAYTCGCQRKGVELIGCCFASLSASHCQGSATQLFGSDLDIAVLWELTMRKMNPRVLSRKDTMCRPARCRAGTSSLRSGGLRK